MTTPPVPDLSFLIPTKYKALAALVGSALSFVVPFVLQATDALPSPWPAVIGVALLILSALGVYHAPYTPPGTVLAPDTPAVAAAATQPQSAPVINPTGGAYRNPWP